MKQEKTVLKEWRMVKGRLVCVPVWNWWLVGERGKKRKIIQLLLDLGYLRSQEKKIKKIVDLSNSLTSYKLKTINTTYTVRYLPHVPKPNVSTELKGIHPKNCCRLCVRTKKNCKPRCNYAYESAACRKSRGSICDQCDSGFDHGVR